MKRFAVLLILAVIFAFAGCQEESSESETEQTAETPTETPTETPAETTTETPKVPETVYHKVSFVSNSETTIESQTVESGKTATEPSKPTKTGYTFSAWYDGENAFDFSTPITKDTTLTAKWTANTYTVTLSNNGEESQVSVTFGEKLGDLESVPTMANSSFGGFYTEEYAKGEKFIGADGKGCKAYEIASDTILYAAWGYRISYENLRDKENPNPEIYTGEEDVALLDLENITGFAFAGWYDAETDGNKVETIAKGESGAKTLYARWTEVSYTVKHFFENLNSSFYMRDYDYTEDINLQESFPGLLGTITEATEKSIEGFEALPFEQKALTIGNTIVKIKYNRKTYAVDFDLRGGTVSYGTLETENVKYQKKAYRPDTFQRKYPYTFINWYTSNDGGKTLDETPFDFTTAIISPFTLYAKWEIKATVEDVVDKINAMSESDTVIIRGSQYGPSSFAKIGDAIRKKTFEIKLDLSGMNDLKIIKSYLFEKCKNLTSICLPDGISEINNSAFYECTGLTNIKLNDGLTYINQSSFSHCTSLESITIPKSVTFIGVRAFNCCTSLTNITFDGTKKQWNDVRKSDEWNYSVPATEVVCSDGTVPLR